MGFEKEAFAIQDLFMDDKRDEAIAMVPTEFADEISLCGPRERIAEKLEDWKQSPVTTLYFHGDVDTLRAMAELAL